MHHIRQSIIALATVASLTACQSDVTSPSTVVVPQANLATVSSGIESRVEFPVTLATFVPCALDFLGEVVVLEGTVRITTQTTVSPSGRATVWTQALLHGVEGRGETSGTAYRGTGVARSSLTLGVGETFRSIDKFAVTAKGRGNDLVLHQSFVHRVEADGTIKTSRLDSKVTCR